MMEKKLIINTEVFLQCKGHCSGCFLSELERTEENTHLTKIKAPLFKKLTENANKYEHYIIGFGRGNLLSMNKESIDELLSVMKECEDILGSDIHITFEVSTSLIGKIDKQITQAKYMLEKNKNIYFNVVINSEVTSEKFWSNWEEFRIANMEIRNNLLLEESGDILVLNVNPRQLPDMNFIYERVKNVPSPVNISMFPFVEKNVSTVQFQDMNKWSINMFEKLKNLDLNIHEYIKRLSTIDISNFDDIIMYHQATLNSYYFIDKNGAVTPGSLSIMGEVDYVRLLEKFNVDPDLEKAWYKMQKDVVCSMCENQAQCLLSGAYLNMLVNSQKENTNNSQCWSGYQKIFEQIK